MNSEQAVEKLTEPNQNYSTKSYHPSQKEDYQDRTPSPETHLETKYSKVLLLVEETSHGWCYCYDVFPDPTRKGLKSSYTQLNKRTKMLMSM